VGPDDPVSLSVLPTRPWAWVHAPSDVVIRALDRFGNVARLNDGVELRSSEGAFSGAGATMVDGLASVEVVPHTASPLDTWVAEASDGLTGTATSIPVLEDCGSAGPIPALTLDGSVDAVRCLGEDPVLVHASVSAAGADRYGLWVPGPIATVSDSSRFDISFRDVGTYPVVALAAEGTCGAEIAHTAYIGEDDGSPTGSIPLSLVSSFLRVDQDTTVISVGPVLDCAGDPAKNGEVFLRTDRGIISGAVASGEGLFVTLDSDGNAEATLDLTAAQTGGAGRVVAWVENGAARGARPFTATGDLVRPRVVNQHPEGAVTGSFSAIFLSFTEPLNPANVGLHAFKITGPSAATIIDVYQPRPDQVELYLASPIASSAGRWTVQLRDSLTDLAGNRLDGAWSGESRDYEADFGSLSSSAPVLLSCEPSTLSFRPDGDDGDGIEADDVTVTLTAVTAPDTWRIVVETADGHPIRHARFDASSAVETWDWDGRDDTERIADDGSYTIRTTPHNADGTAGASCSATVAIDNKRGT